MRSDEPPPGRSEGGSHRSAKHEGCLMSEVASPCTSVCRMNERSGWCEGCLRTIDEIVQWSSLDDAAKRRVWRLLEQRREVVDGPAG